MKFNDMLTIDLQLFDGAAAASGAESGAGTADAGEGSAKGETKGAVPGTTRRGKKAGEFQNVLFGKQEAVDAPQKAEGQTEQSHAAGETQKEVVTPSDTLEERRKAFKKMINGEYNDVFTEEAQRIINRRFSETKALETQLQEQKPLIDLLSQRYSIADGDMKKLAAAIENDNAYWSEAAEEAGMSVEQYKEVQKLKRDNAALLAAEKGRVERERSQKQAEQWVKEAQAVRAKYPDFDLGQELEDQNFVAMLRAGTPLEHAYKVKHFEELMENALQVTAANTEKRIVENVRAKGNRPVENGMAAQSAFTVKDDVSKLTKKERAEIARRVLGGAKISF